MREANSKDLQSAQGMVEFALVLPILLLLIFGIFAFGHLFFAYSSVVSASREAARWGSAVGTAGAMLPRYQDCTAIRDTAVRVGAFAGVTATDGPDDENTPGIYIGFDHGPNDPDPDFDDCSDDYGPNAVSYGDRINVRVTIQYETIVPLVNIPTFPLSATTSRTIVHNLPVSEGLVANPACRRTTIDMEFVPNPFDLDFPGHPVVGEPVNVNLIVLASDGTFPEGVVEIYDMDAPASFRCTFNVPNPVQPSLPVSCPEPLVPAGGYTTAGIRRFAVHFDAPPYNSTDCDLTTYSDQMIENEPLEVYKADTSVEIISHVDEPSWPGQAIMVTFRVTVDAPGAGTPTGWVVVRSNDGINPETTCSGPVDPLTGIGTCSGLYPVIDTTLTARYIGTDTINETGDPNFNSSEDSAPVLHLVHPPPTEEPPDYCPWIVEGSLAIVNTNNQYGGQMEISNADGELTAIDNVEISWPVENDVGVEEIRFGPNATIDACSTSDPQEGGNCLWQNDYSTNGDLTPPYRLIDHLVSNWRDQYSVLPAGEAKTLRLLFSSDLPSGIYRVRINFVNGCFVNVTGNFAP